jgi:hypothetical protein
MDSKLNLIKRFLAETPPFWRLVQIISLAVVAIISDLAKLSIVSDSVFLLVSGAGSALALFAQFAVVDTPILLEAIDHPESLLHHIPEILSQVKELKQAYHDASTDASGAKVVKMYPEININDMAGPVIERPTAPDPAPKQTR